MDNHLESIAKSYDRSVRLGRKGIDLYNNLPDYLKNDPDYLTFQNARSIGLDSDSGRKDIMDYLSPTENMKFIDLGCCLNLMFNGYDKWASIYHGVDISEETIILLREFSIKNALNIGGIYCVSIHETPFSDCYFDIGACIGVLEYFEKDFIIKALMEAYRIIKPDGKFVLDIPDNGNQMRQFMKSIESYMGRPDKFDLTPQEFNDILSDYFVIVKTENIESVAMIQYFLRRRK